MNVSSAVSAGFIISSTARTAGVTGTDKPAASGNALPESGPVQVRPVNRQDADIVSPSNDQVSPSPISTNELHGLVDQANETLQGRFSDLKFTVAEGTDISVVRIEDTETGELIRQIPSEAMVAIARALDEAHKGMMLEEQV